MLLLHHCHIVLIYNYISVFHVFYLNIAEQDQSGYMDIDELDPSKLLSFEIGSGSSTCAGKSCGWTFRAQTTLPSASQRSHAWLFYVIYIDTSHLNTYFVT